MRSSNQALAVLVEKPIDCLKVMKKILVLEYTRLMDSTTKKWYLVQKGTTGQKPWLFEGTEEQVIQEKSRREPFDGPLEYFLIRDSDADAEKPTDEA